MNIIKFIAGAVLGATVIYFIIWSHFFAPCELVKWWSTATTLPARCLTNLK